VPGIGGTSISLPSYPLLGCVQYLRLWHSELGLSEQHPARYISFHTNMHTGEPKILGTNGAEHQVHVKPLEAAPSQGPMLTDDTLLEHLKEWCFVDGDRCCALQELGDNRILAEVV